MSAPARSLIFETHATSLDNEAGLASGWFDIELSATGVSQAAALGERYRDTALSKVYCSDLRRAQRTGEIAFESRGIPIAIDRRLRECDYGALTRETASRVDQVRLDFVTDPFPGGESYEQVAGRVRAWLGEAATGPLEQPVLVIGHRAIFYALEHLLNGVPLRGVIAAPWRWQPGWRYQLPPCRLGANPGG
jgi:broad specificity phosphatase PhoE